MKSFPMHPQVLLRKPTLLLRVSEKNPEPQITVWGSEREVQRVREVQWYFMIEKKWMVTTFKFLMTLKI